MNSGDYAIFDIYLILDSWYEVLDVAIHGACIYELKLGLFISRFGTEGHFNPQDFLHHELICKALLQYV